jgi:hypothetical protein
MARCNACGTFILFGGASDGDYRYCNEKCQADDLLREAAKAIPEDYMQEQIQAVHAGECPKCGGSGPVDVHVSYTAWSALVMTGWKSQPQICCRGCARKSQAMAFLQTGVLGWWGFPWGLIMTPIQMGRNLIGMVTGPNPFEPSDTLEKIIRRSTAAQMIELSQRKRAAAGADSD